VDDVVKTMGIGARLVGEGQPCFIIAEAGVNHDGHIETARQLVDAAVRAGADAVKFQTFDPDQLATADAPKAAYQVSLTDANESQLEMLRKLTLSEADHHELEQYCRDVGILFLSTPFDEASADLLATFDLPAFKISSGDLTNLPFLAHVARLGRPMLLSTGMATADDVAAALEAIRAAGGTDVLVLQCVSNYPADPADVNLRAMHTMARQFNVPVGFSDHTLGNEVALAAVALGACVVEKHLTLDRNQPGPDHQSSSEPDEFQALVRGIRRVEAALGHGRKEPSASEADVARAARKSLVAARDIPAGFVMTEDAIAIRRPGSGLSPARRAMLVGRTSAHAIAAGTLLTEDMFT